MTKPKKKTRKQIAKLGGLGFAAKYKGTEFVKQNARRAANARWNKDA